MKQMSLKEKLVVEDKQTDKIVEHDLRIKFIVAVLYLNVFD